MPNIGRLESVVSTPTSQKVSSTHLAATFGSIPFRVCGAQSSMDVALDYPQAKDNPTLPCL